MSSNMPCHISTHGTLIIARETDVLVPLYQVVTEAQLTMIKNIGLVFRNELNTMNA